MGHEQDADDARLLASGEHARLLAKWEPVIVGRCIAALRGSLDADDVAQDVELRLWRELSAGKTYGGLPFRVVVHKVVDWTLGDYRRGRPTDVPLPEGWDAPGPDGLGELLDRDAVESLIGGADGRAREVLELRYVERLEIEEIAGRLGIARNAVDQALHRGHRKLRETLGRG